MITVQDAWLLPAPETQPDAAVPGALDPEAIAALEYLDACAESALHEHGFDGRPFEFRIPDGAAPPEAIAALRARWEAPVGPNGERWIVGTFPARDDATGAPAVQLVFAATHVQVGARTVQRTPRPPRSGRPRVLLIADVRGWAFDSNLTDLIRALGEEFEFDRFYTEDWWKGARPDWGQWDVIYECYHANPAMGIPLDRALGALRSQWFDGRTREPPTAANIAMVNQYRAFHVAALRNYNELRAYCPRAVYLTNPVDMQRFPHATHARQTIVASWNGNALHRTPDGVSVKHFYDVIVPATQAAGVPLVAAEYGTPEGPWRRRTFEEMPDFYRQANVALCASEYEAASASVMEAMASGLAVLATDVGNHRELMESQIQHLGDSGIVLLDGTVDAFTRALRELPPGRVAEMGALNRAEIAARWSWAAWRDRYRDFLRSGL